MKNSIKQLGLAALTVCTPMMFVDDAQSQLEEIVVVAQKRAENIQDVPVTIEAFSAERLKEAHIDELQELTYSLVGVDLGAFAKEIPSIAIRGQRGDASGDAGGDPSASFFVDGVFMARPGMWSQKMFDIERIEVLKGPQGTLYGQNAMSGTVNIYTRRPTDELFGTVEASVGNLGLTEAQALVNFPISDNFFGMFSAVSEQRDAYFNNTGGIDGGEVDTQGARLKFLWEPTDTFDVLFALDGMEDAGTVQQRKARPIFGWVLNAPLIRFFPNPPADFPNNDPYTQELSHAGFSNRETSGGSVTANWTTDSGTWTAIAAHRELDFGLSFDADGLSQSQATVTRREDSDLDQLEVRYASELNGRLNFTAGLFYYETNIKQEVSNWILPDVRPAPSTFLLDVNSDSVAVFGEFYFDLSDTTTLIFGGRRSMDEKSGSFDGVNTGGVDYQDVTSEVDWNNTSAKLGIQHFLNDNIMLFATAVEGFKAGGLQGRGVSPEEAATTFQPEEGLNVELGIKAQFLNDSLRFNATYFDTDYEDLQITVRNLTPTGQTLSQTANRAEASVSGLELQLDWLPTDSLEIGVGYGYLSGDVNDAITQEQETVPGPEHTLNLSVRYGWQLNTGGEIVLRFDGNLNQLEELQSPDPRDLIGFPDLEYASMRLAYTPAHERWEVALWGRNLTEFVDWLACFDLGAFTPTAASSCAPSEPRTAGATFTYNFGQ